MENQKEEAPLQAEYPNKSITFRELPMSKPSTIQSVPDIRGRLLRRLTTLFCGLLLLAVLLACYRQFLYDHLFPLVAAALLSLVIVLLRPKLRWLCLTILVLTSATLGIDAFLLRHRFTVTIRTSDPLWNTERIEDVFPSPSGRTTAYLVGSHWIDSGYWVYLSEGGLFLKRIGIRTSGADDNYPRDFQVRWEGPALIAATNKQTLLCRESQ